MIFLVIQMPQEDIITFLVTIHLSAAEICGGGLVSKIIDVVNQKYLERCWNKYWIKDILDIQSNDTSIYMNNYGATKCKLKCSVVSYQIGDIVSGNIAFIGFQKTATIISKNVAVKISNVATVLHRPDQKPDGILLSNHNKPIKNMDSEYEIKITKIFKSTNFSQLNCQGEMIPPSENTPDNNEIVDS